MSYFINFPKIINNNRLVTDIVTRIKITDTWLNDPRIYYEYDYQEHDKPEDIASKYYGDSFLHWIILITNNIFDSTFDFPLNYENFTNYINDKYYNLGQQLNPTRNGIEYAQITLDPIFRYQKYIKISDYLTKQVISEEYFVIDEQSYSELYAADDPYYTIMTMKDGTQLLYEVSRRFPIVSIFDHELELNESKRRIKLLKKEYIPQAKQEFIKLMSMWQ